MTLKNCPCDSNKPHRQCCLPLLTGQSFAKTPVQLMRSRYAAYALGGHGKYLLETWLPSAAVGLSAADLSIRSVAWVGLNVLSKSQQGESGFVEFEAIYLNEMDGREVHHEKSAFSRIRGRWFYVSGEVAN